MCQPRSGSATEITTPDSSETIVISPLALLKMLKHARAGVPMEVMGLLLGKIVDDYTIVVDDVFAMPQSGTGVSIESIDEVYQTKMMDLIKQTGRHEMSVGWYHSHPGFGCWLSGTDMHTQKAFEQTLARAVAVVIDPIQSVKGKVIIDAFRLIDMQLAMFGKDPRQTTCNVGLLKPISINAAVHGLGRFYYSLNIRFSMTAEDQKVLMSVHRKPWTKGLTMTSFRESAQANEAAVKDLLKLSKEYNDTIQEDMEITSEQRLLKYTGRQDPKRHVEEKANVMMSTNIVDCLAAMLNTVVFR